MRRGPPLQHERASPYLWFYMATSCLVSIACSPVHRSSLRWPRQIPPPAMQICEPFLAWRVPKGHVTAFANGLCYSTIPHYRSVCSVKQCSSKVPLIGARRAADDSALALCSPISPCDTRFLTRQCFLFARTNSKCQSGTIYRGRGATLGWFRGGTQHQSNRISSFGRSFLAALSSSSRNDDEQTGDMREGVSEKLDKSQKVYEGMKNQIDKYKPSDAAQGRLQADEDDQDDDGEDAVPRHTRGQRARTTRPRQAADSGQQDSDVNLQKIMRACHRRVRAGGAGAVSSSVATLSAARAPHTAAAVNVVSRSNAVWN